MGIYVKVGANTNEFDRSMKQVKKDLENTVGGSAMKASQKMLKITTGLVAGFVALGAASVKMAAEVQQTRAALVTLTKSAEVADKLLKDVKTFAATTPFEFKGLAQASQQMVAFGFEAKAVVPILRVVGDAVSGLGGDQESMNSVVRILGQIQTKGKVTAKEIMQLAQQGVNAWQYLADASGKTVAQMQKDVSKGGMDSAAAIKAIVLGMDKQFEGGMERQSKTLMGIWSTVRENVTGVMRQIGASITEGFSLEEKFGKFSDWLSKFTMEVEHSGFKEAFADLVPEDLKTSLVVVAGIVTGICVPAFAMWAVATIAATWPLLALGAACGAVAVFIYKNWESVGPFFSALWDGIIGVFQNAYKAIAATINGIASAWNWMKEKLGLETGKTVLEVEIATATTKGDGKDELKATLGTLKSGSGGGSDAAAKAAEAAAKKAAKAAEAAAKKTQRDWESLVKAAESTSKSIESAWLDMTGSQRDILEAWHRDQLIELEKSKAANVNYTRDKIRLAETYTEKSRQLSDTEAKDRAATIKEITNGYKDMYDKLAEMGLKGSAKDLFGMKKAADDDIKAMSDSFAKMTADFASATDAQKKNILDALDEAGAAYKVTSDGNLDVSEENAKFRLQRMKQHAKDEAEYHRMGRGIQADIDKAYDELSLEQLKQTLGEKEALQLGYLEATRIQMDTYMAAMKDACAPVEVMFANMAETFRVGFADALSDVIMGVSTLSEAFESLGKSILQVIVDYYAKQLAGKMMVALFGAAALAKETAASTTAGAAVAKAWTAAAANVSLASFGANAGPAMAGIASTHALTTALSIPALAKGGETNGPTVALIGEGRYKEAVFPLSDDTFSRFADGISKAGGAEKGATLNVYGDINNASDEGRITKNLFKKSNFALMGA